MLGVDPDTLRRWSDEGRVEAFTTPGGHRRFDPREIERLLETRHPGAASLPPLASLGATTDRMSRVYRESYATAGPNDGVRSAIPASSREAFRTDGRGLVASLVAYLDAEDDDARAAAEARAADLTDDLAKRLAAAGLSLTEAVGPLRRGAAAVPGRARVRSPGVGPSARTASARCSRTRRRSSTGSSSGSSPPTRPSPDMPLWLLPTLTALLAFVFSVALLDQWLERGRGFQLAWAIGMLLFGIGSAAEAIAAAAGWSDALYRAWYLAGAVLTPAWLGLGTAFLLGRTRFGYTYAALLLFSGLVALMIRNSPAYAGAGPLPLLYLIAAVILALAIATETYFQNDSWTRFAAAAVVGSTILAVVLMAVTVLPPPGYSLDPTTGQPTGELMPGYLRLLTPILNFTGALALLFGAVFSIYVFMPKKRVLAYSLDPNQPGDQFLFNLLIAPVAIIVNLIASLPAAGHALLNGQLHSRVPATILIAVGAFIPTITDYAQSGRARPSCSRPGKFLGVVFLFTGFLISIETFREIRVPFTSIRLATARRERGPVAHDEAGAEPAGADPMPDSVEAARGS